MTNTPDRSGATGRPRAANIIRRLLDPAAARNDPSGNGPARPPTPRHGLRAVLFGVGLFLLITGILLFTEMQTQSMFKDNIASDVSSGRVPRNDAGLAFGALTAGAGITVALAAASQRPVRERLGPAIGTGLAATTLLLIHFTVFVNGVIIPNQGTTYIQASFLFHDAEDAMPIATFLLAAVTTLLLAGLALGLLALLAPATMRSRLRRPSSFHDQRARLVVMALFVSACGARFAREFFTYAWNADADPVGGAFATNLVVVYYLLTVALLFALGVMAWRIYKIVWGRFDVMRSLTFRRQHAYLLHLETWLAGIVGVLIAITLVAEPIFEPDAAAVSHVLAMNSKGVSGLFVGVMALYVALHRMSRTYVDWLRREAPVALTLTRDRLWYAAVVSVAVWAGSGIVLAGTDLFPLTRLVVPVAMLAVILPFFALRMDLAESLDLKIRSKGGVQIMLAATCLSLLAGLMLWGAGNSVTTSYVRGAGGFFTPEGNVLQPYATGIRLLGSLFLSTPVVLALWVMAGRFQTIVNPGPLIVLGLSVVVAMNTLFAIRTEDPFDSEAGQTDVLVGIGTVWATSVLDKTVFIGIGTLVLGLAYIAFLRLVLLGIRPGAHPSPTGRGSPMGS